MTAPARSHRPVAVKQVGRVLQTAACVVTVVVFVGAPLLWGGVWAAGLVLFTAGLLWGRRGRSVSLPFAAVGVA